MQALIDDEASQPQQDDNALDQKWFSIHMGEDGIQIGIICLHQALKVDFMVLLEK